MLSLITFNNSLTPISSLHFKPFPFHPHHYPSLFPPLPLYKPFLILYMVFCIEELMLGETSLQKDHTHKFKFEFSYYIHSFSLLFLSSHFSPPLPFFIYSIYVLYRTTLGLVGCCQSENVLGRGYHLHWLDYVWPKTNIWGEYGRVDTLGIFQTSCATMW